MSAVKQYRDMTAEDMLAWGLEESRLRQQDLAGVKSHAELQTAQNNAARRRKVIGASVSAASSMVIEANRHLRRTGAAS